MMKKLFALLVFFLFVQTSWSQNEYDNEVPETKEEEFVGFSKKNRTKKDLCRLRLGGGLGFSLYNNEIGFSISPMLGYQVVEDRIELGAGIFYDIYRYKDNSNRIKYIQNTVGLNTYARFYVWKGLFAQFRGSVQNSYRKLNAAPLTPIMQWNIFGGAGYQIKLGTNAYFNIGLEINFLPYDLTVVASRAPRVISPFFNFQYAFCR